MTSITKLKSKVLLNELRILHLGKIDFIRPNELIEEEEVDFRIDLKRSFVRSIRSINGHDSALNLLDYRRDSGSSELTVFIDSPHNIVLKGEIDADLYI